MVLNIKLAYKLIQDLKINGKKSVDYLVLHFLFVNQMQNGVVRRVHYTEICNLLKITRQTFYTTIDKLVELGYITYSKDATKNGYYDFTVLGNSYKEIKGKLYFDHYEGFVYNDDPNKRESEYRHYVDLNQSFFEWENLFTFKTNEIKTALLILATNIGKQCTMKIETVQSFLGVANIYIAYEYVNAVTRYISNEEFAEDQKFDTYTKVSDSHVAAHGFTYRKEAKTLRKKLLQFWTITKNMKKKITARDEDSRRQRYLVSFFKHHGIDYDENSLRETILYYNQYKNRHNVHAITELILKTVLDTGSLRNSFKLINTKLSKMKSSLGYKFNSKGYQIDCNLECVEYLW